MYFSQPNRFLIFLAICFLIFLTGIFEIPILDRDEARFATASKTMLLENEFIDIKMYDEPRYKKPVGIYWLQVASNFIFGDIPYDNITLYRLPSILSIFLAFIFIFFRLRKIFDNEISFLTIFFLMFSLLTLSEMLQAKTDGALFLTIILCNLMIYSLIENHKIKYKEKLIFWSALAIGVLIKGPIIFIYTILPLIIFSIIKRKNFLKEIFCFSGLILFLILTLPWFIIITIKSNGAFWYESVGHDLLGKVSSGQESHGFPPGYYLITTLILFWPGSILIYPFIKKNFEQNFIRIRKDDLTFFLLISFSVPYILFELVSTKLPHYIYPSYLPLSILLSKFLLDENLEGISKRSLYFFTLIFPLTVVFLIYFIIAEYSEITITLAIILIFFILQILFMIGAADIKRFKKKLINFSVFQISFYLILVFYINNHIQDLWVAKRINSIIELNKKNYDKIYNYGFEEPSLVFLTSHKSKKISPNLLDSINLKKERIMFIINDEFSDLIISSEKYSDFKMLNKFDGFNYSKGKTVTIKVFSNSDND
ncbi:MAG: ArnT family glycosyltransferase [Alphaproteobacteria bacterium]|tara:strand:+ start:2670 stop:4289 length:1620 start_codon:yes stop_codon:yes gene_type:complete